MESQVTINADQSLFVIPCGSGYSCLGFDVTERKSKAIHAWLTRHRQTVPELIAERGTLEAYAEFQRLCELGREFSARTSNRCGAELTPELIGLERKLVEVTGPDGYKERFYVGKSTGWMPCHLEILRRDSSGGGSAYIPKGGSVRVVGSR